MEQYEPLAIAFTELDSGALLAVAVTVVVIMCGGRLSYL